MDLENRPAPSPPKLISQYNDWLEGNEMPGRTLSYLKTGFFDEILAEAEESESVLGMRKAWETWERGSVDPKLVLDALKDNGMGEFLAALIPK